MTQSRKSRDSEAIRRLIRDNHTSETLHAAVLAYVTHARAAERGEWLERVNAAERALQEVEQNP